MSETNNGRQPHTAMAIYLVRPERVDEVGNRLREHWPLLRENQLATGTPAVVYSGQDSHGSFFVEFVEWTDAEATGRAFRTDAISVIWQDLYAYTEARDGRPAVEYPTVTRLEFPDDHATTTTTDAPSSAYTAMAIYQVRPEKVEAFTDLMRRNWPALRSAELVTARPPVVYSGEGDNGPFFVEFVEWVDADAPSKAFRDENVSPIWQDLYAFTEARSGRPAVEYPTVVRQDWFATQGQ
ncbi:MAG: hypothetical protein ACRDTA_29890 [Pseudonocardiaceae bacterium]